MLRSLKLPLKAPSLYCGKPIFVLSGGFVCVDTPHQPVGNQQPREAGHPRPFGERDFAARIQHGQAEILA